MFAEPHPLENGGQPAIKEPATLPLTRRCRSCRDKMGHACRDYCIIAQNWRRRLICCKSSSAAIRAVATARTGKQEQTTSPQRTRGGWRRRRNQEDPHASGALHINGNGRGQRGYPCGNTALEASSFGSHLRGPKRSWVLIMRRQQRQALASKHPPQQPKNENTFGILSREELFCRPVGRNSVH